MELLKGGCVECSNTKSAAVSLASFCHECGFDRTEIVYEIPSDKFDEVVRDILMIFDFHQLKPQGGGVSVPGYHEILKRLAV